MAEPRPPRLRQADLEVTLDAPFPSPLAGEGGARPQGGRVRGLAPPACRQPPHLPIAAAMGPFLSREGRGVQGASP
jgi:hypothetical protein